MKDVLELMRKLNYVERIPDGYIDLRFLDRALAKLGE